jgi:hypothetical protein
VLVRPGKLAIKKRDIKKTQGRNAVIENGCFDRIEVMIGFLPMVANKIEISHHGHQGGQGREDLLNSRKEVSFEGMGARTIDINNREFKVIRAKGKGSSDRKIVDGVRDEVHNIRIPSGNNATRGAIGRFKNKRAKRSGRKDEAKNEKMSNNFDSCRQRMEGQMASIAALTSSRL